MARISKYTQDTGVTKNDKLLGSDYETGSTKNFSLESISKFLKETNSSGASTQFNFTYGSSSPSTGECTRTSSDGTFTNTTSLKVSKYVFGDEDNPINTALTLLNQRDIVISNLDDPNNFAVFNAGSFVVDSGDSNFYDLAVTHKNSNGSWVEGKIYSINIYPGAGDLSYTHTQSSAATTWTIAHNLGKYPSVTIKFSTGAEYDNNNALGGVTFTDANNLTINLAAAESGVAYLN
jgi:hypothetical protein